MSRRGSSREIYIFAYPNQRSVPYFQVVKQLNRSRFDFFPNIRYGAFLLPWIFLCLFSSLLAVPSTKKKMWSIARGRLTSGSGRSFLLSPLSLFLYFSGHFMDTSGKVFEQRHLSRLRYYMRMLVVYGQKKKYVWAKSEVCLGLNLSAIQLASSSGKKEQICFQLTVMFFRGVVLTV